MSAWDPESWDEEPVPIMFTERKGYVSGTWRGMPVYRHREFEDVIRPGSVWFCTLTLNPKTRENYFAAPVREVTREDMAELMAERAEDMLEIMLDHHRADLLWILRELYAGFAASRKEEPDDLEEEPEAEDEIPDAPVELLPQEPRETAEHTGVSYPVGAGCQVEIVGPNALRSDLFTESRYFVSISPDLRQMRFRADRNGSVRCREGRIELKGLERAINGRDPSEFTVSVSSEGRTIVVRLPRVDRELDREAGPAGARVALQVAVGGRLGELDRGGYQRTPAHRAARHGEGFAMHERT